MSLSMVGKVRKCMPDKRPLLLLCRSLNQDLTTALRPFYFAVHPDFFAQHPEQRNTNENSLKLLSEHLEALYERRQKNDGTGVLKFYVRASPDADKRDSFRLIKIRTDKQSTRDPKIFIQGLLESCNLSTEYVKKIKPQPEPPKSSGPHMGFQPGKDYHYDKDFADFEYQVKNERASKRPDISSWLKDNVGKAKQRAKETAELQAEIDKLQKTLVAKLKLRDARYECGWNIEHYRGCLKTLERLANTHGVELAPLKGRIVVFAPFTGISLEGHVMLFTGDVLNNWIDFIKNIPHHDTYLKVVPVYERTLSRVLLDIQIGRRKFMPKQQASGYANHLMKVTTSLNDYLGKQKFPKGWPESLKEFTIVVESEAGPLMVSPTGQFITPATCPGAILVDFISQNMNLARDRMKQYAQDKHVEQELINSCIKKLQLHALTKDDAITPDKMISALRDVSEMQLQSLQQGKLHITHYYSILTDGTMCIPWDFKTK
ncbi:hypothetical protein KR026_007302 [Drosophila bipectinata]|nr:hypothetical protein KR026_007302 [Drosophila bipectinata]